MSTLKVNTLEEATSGGATFYTAKAWAKINASTGSPVIEGEGNISSVTDLGVGGSLFNFSDNLTDANYSSVATTSGAVVGAHTVAFFSNFGTETATYTSSQVQVSCLNPANSNQRADNQTLTLIVAR